MVEEGSKGIVDLCVRCVYVCVRARVHVLFHIWLT